MKLGNKVSDRLLNLLYTTTSTEIATKVPIVTKKLYEGSSDGAKPKSLLDDLMENEWKQRPLAEAVNDIPSGKLTKRRGNILKLRCANSYISQHDFANIYPVNRERQYILTDEIRKGIPVKMVKGRNPLTLRHIGTYYLIFANHTQACAYYMETSNKMLNGMPLRFEFAQATAEDLKFMTSAYLDNSVNEFMHHKVDQFDLSALDSISVQSLLNKLPGKSTILSEILKLEEERIAKGYNSSDIDPTFNLLSSITELKHRRSCVLVRNLPFGLSKHALPKLLWDYDLAPLPRLSHCFTTIVNDPIKQAHSQLIRFADMENAKRFVTRFHGKRWESSQSQPEKRLYEPILCEIVD